jgi:ferredoxin/flavodoxin
MKMPASIYYFTGTGNSLHTARRIADALGDARVINIARQKGHATIEDKSDTVGIVFPVYYYRLPRIVHEFVEKLRLDTNAYIFAVGTCGGDVGNSLSELDGLLRKNGGHLSAGFKALMPDNAYIGMNLVTPLDERAGVLKASEERLSSIIEAIKKKDTSAYNRGSGMLSAIMGIAGSGFAMNIYRLPKRFKATEKCNCCAVCEKICPVGNITRDGKKVTWGNKCVQCLACFHWCPETAIEIGGKSANVPRYHHPDITLNDMLK